MRSKGVYGGYNSVFFLCDEFYSTWENQKCRVLYKYQFTMTQIGCWLPQENGIELAFFFFPFFAANHGFTNPRGSKFVYSTSNKDRRGPKIQR